MNIWKDLKVQYTTGDVTTRLIFANIFAFVLSIIFFYKFKFGIFDYPRWLSLSSDPMEVLRAPWTILSYSFLHAGFFHLLFNMIVLNFSGRMFLTFFSQKQMFGLYILAAVFSGLAFFASYWVLGRYSGIVGASGAIMAILIATATYSPNMNLRLLLIGNVKLWHFAAVVIVLDLLYILVENTGGHIAHLAGAFFGFFYVRLLGQGTDLSRMISVISDKITIITSKKQTPFRKVHKNSAPRQSRTISRIVTKSKVQQQIDEILDKIGRSGYDSLTKEEKEFLFKAGKQ